MGRVFTSEEIKRNQLPTPGDFDDVLDAVEIVCTRESCLVAGLVYGSVLTGKANVRSDLDLIIVYNGAEAVRAHQVLREIVQAGHEHYVPVNIMAYSHVTAVMAGYRNGPMFCEHLRSAAARDGVLCGDPVSLLGTSRIPQTTEALTYAVRKHETLTAALAGWPHKNDKERAQVRTKMVEVPLRVARRCLEAVLNRDCSGESRAEIRALVGTRIGRDVGTHLERLLAVDAAYTAYLAETYIRCDGVAHEAWIERHLDARFAEILAFVEHIAFATYNLLAPRA